MKNIIKNECKRTIFSKGMATALTIGLIIIGWHLYQHVWGPGIASENAYCPESVFYRWIGASSYPMQSYLYYLILPLLAVLPGGINYYEDLKTGYLQNIYTRTKCQNFLAAKYISVTIAGGIAVVVPLLVDLYATCIRFPALIPEPIMSFGPERTAFGFQLFYSHPWIHTILFLVLDFLFAGAIVGISLVTTFYTEYKFAVLITPFICYYFIYSINSFFPQINFRPNLFLTPGFSDNHIAVPLIGLFLLILIAVFYFWKGERYEAK